MSYEIGFKGTGTTQAGASRMEPVTVSATNPLPVTTSLGGLPGAAYASPNGTSVMTDTTLGSLFSDDFGGNAVDTVNNWDVIDGGLGANANLGRGVLTQAAIGSGITGMTDVVSASGLAVTLGIVQGAERWYLSKQVFAGKEDILAVLSMTAHSLNSSLFIGLVEVDPTTWVPLLNPNFVGDANNSMEFTNRGGAEFMGVALNTSYHAEAVGDSSSAKASGVTGVANVMTITQEYLIEIDSRDVIVSSAAIDNITAKAANASRVSSQCPNDKRLYKLLMRFRNVGVPAANVVTVNRILVADNYEMRVQISSGEGDTIANKAIPVNAQLLANAAGNPPVVGSIVLSPDNSRGAALTLKGQCAANTTGILFTSANTILGGYLYNRAAYDVFVKVYNKATAPTVGTDTPIQTWCVKTGASLNVAGVVPAYGLRGNLGIGIGITKAYADGDTTSPVAADLDYNFIGV